MALASVGSGTYIWNNNIRSVILLCFYPLIVLVAVWFCFFIASEGWRWQAEWYWPHTVEFLSGYGWMVLLAITGWLTTAWFLNAAMTRKMSGAVEVSRQSDPELHHLLEVLCISRGVPMPRLNIIETHARNAFASGVSQRSFSITVTRGLLQSLPKDEVEAVLAHELAHILNRDVRLLTVCIIFTGMFGFTASVLWRFLRHFGRSRVRISTGRRGKGGGQQLVMVLYGVAIVLSAAYVVSLLARFAVSRVREYSADAGGIEMTRNPDAMMRALLRMSGRDRIPDTTDDVALMCVVNSRPAFMGLFRTHPSIEDRIAPIARIFTVPEPDRPLGPVGAGYSFMPPAAIAAAPGQRHRRHPRASVPVTAPAPASVPGVTDAPAGKASVQAEQLDADEDRG